MREGERPPHFMKKIPGEKPVKLDKNGKGMAWETNRSRGLHSDRR